MPKFLQSLQKLFLFLLLGVTTNLFAELPKEPTDPKDALFRSKLITTKTEGHAVDVKAKINGIQNLYLTVSDGGNSYSCDWADWALPRLVDNNGNETRLTDL